jgi:hypothetical protein
MGRIPTECISGLPMMMQQRRMRPGSKVYECISVEKITGSNIITIECISGYKSLVQIVLCRKKVGECISSKTGSNDCLLRRDRSNASAGTTHAGSKDKGCVSKGTEQKTTMSARKLVTVVQDPTQCQNNECDLLS